MSCVLPGLPEIFANLLRSVTMLINEDLPTLDLPIKAYSGFPSVGHNLMSTLEITNSAFLIFTLCILCKDRELTFFLIAFPRNALFLNQLKIES